MPCRRQSASTSLKKPGGGTIMPPSDWIGSRKSAATSPGGTGPAKSSSRCSSAAPRRCRFGAAVAIGVRIRDQRQPFGLGDARLHRMAGNRHRAGRAAVIGAAEGDDARPAGRRHDGPRHGLVGVGARMAEPDAAPRALRHDGEKLFRELDRRRVRRREMARAGLARARGRPPRESPDANGRGSPRPRRRRNREAAGRRRR